MTNPSDQLEVSFRIQMALEGLVPLILLQRAARGVLAAEPESAKVKHAVALLEAHAKIFIGEVVEPGSLTTIARALVEVAAARGSVDFGGKTWCACRIRSCAHRGGSPL